MTSAAAACSSSGTRVVFDGQSLNIVPTTSSYPAQTMANAPGVPWKNVAIGGAAIVQLTRTVADRVDRWPALSAYTIYVLCEGTTEIGLAETGADFYTAIGAYADHARSVGYDYVIATTISPSTIFSGGVETERQNANTLLLADASGKFDDVVDVTTGVMADPNDTTYYVDGTHFTAAGAGVVAGIVYAALSPVLAAHP